MLYFVGIGVKHLVLAGLAEFWKLAKDFFQGILVEKIVEPSAGKGLGVFVGFLALLTDGYEVRERYIEELHFLSVMNKEKIEAQIGNTSVSMIVKINLCAQDPCDDQTA